MADSLAGRVVLVTGARGFVGRRLVARLTSIGADARPVGVDGILPAAPTPPVVIHLAATRTDSTPAARLEAVRVNVTGTALVLEAAAKHKASRFVHVGGALEYAPTHTPMDEDAAVVPQGYYGASKAAGSALALQRGRIGDLHTVVLRPFLVYGPGQDHHRLIPTVMRAAETGHEVALTGPGPARDWVYVDDLVAACLAAAVTEEVASATVINVGTGTQHTNHEVARLAREVTGRPIRVRSDELPPRAWDRPAWVSQPARLRAMLGVHPRPLREGLAATWGAWPW